MKNHVLAALTASMLACTEPPPPPRPVEAPTEVPITSTSPDAIGMFKKGRELEETSHPVEAEKLYRMGLSFDAKFARGWVALLPFVASREAGEIVAKVKPLAAGLPDAERLFVEMRIAEVEGDQATVLAHEAKLAEMLPKDWRVQLALAGRANEHERFDEALAAFKRVTELRPDAGGAWNSIGYIHLEMNRIDEAVSAFRKYAEMSPTDPNAHDSLGDALWRADKLDEAEASYRKALEVDPAFLTAKTGIALTYASRGDWKTALEVMQQYVDATARDIDKPEALLEQAWWLYAAGKKNDALRTLTDADQAAEKASLDYLGLNLMLSRAEMLNGQGKHDDALTIVDTAVDRGAAISMPGQRAFQFKVSALSQRLEAHAGRRAKEAAASVAEQLDVAIKTQPSTPYLASVARHARGDALVAAGDLKGALVEYAGCVVDEVGCLRRGVWAADKLKDKDAAAALRAKLRASPARSGELVRARAEAKLFAAK